MIIRGFFRLSVLLALAAIISGCSMFGGLNLGPNFGGLIGAPDNTAPYVVQAIPTNGSWTIAVNLSNIVVFFSEEVTGVNSNTLRVTNAGTPVLDIVSYTNKVAIFNCTNAPLIASTTYYIILSNGISDTRGNALAPTNFSFWTSNSNDTAFLGWINPFPLVSNVSPLQADLNVAINEQGYVYYILLTNGTYTMPSPVQVKAGLSPQGGPALKSGWMYVTNFQSGTFVMEGLDGPATYDIFAVACDIYGNFGPVQTKRTFFAPINYKYLPFTDGYVSDTIMTNKTNYYYFNAVSNQTYAVYYDDGFFNTNLYYNLWNGKYRFQSEDYNTTYLQANYYSYRTNFFTSLKTQKIYVDVEGYNPYNAGTFGIRVQPIDTYPVQGTVTLPAGISIMEEAVWRITISKGNYSYYLSGRIPNGTTSFQFQTNVFEAGNYDIYCLVDADNSRDQSDGDGVGWAYKVPVDSSHSTCDIPLSLSGTYSVSGSISLPAVLGPSIYAVCLSRYTFEGSEPDYYVIDYVSNTTTFNYSIAEVQTGNYYLFCLADANTNGDFFDDGDYFGYYGDTGSTPPDGPNVFLSGSSLEGMDITYFGIITNLKMK